MIAPRADKAMYIQWYNGLFDRGVRGDPRNYLSNHVPNLENRLIIAKQLSRLDDPEDTYMMYTSFRSYVELYKFILITPSDKRIFHEVTPESARQKLRFDLDIKRDAHAEFLLGSSRSPSEREGMKNLAMFGEYIKDLVITTLLEVLFDLRRGELVSPELDVMLFTSHGKNKRSYHIVLPRYYVCGVSQAEAFWNCCLLRCRSELDRDIFSRFVDRGPYSRNAPLRMLWSGKIDGTEFRVKKYSEMYTYRGTTVSHILLADEDKRDITFRRKNTLHQSLVSFSEESEALPHIGAPTMPRIVNYTDIDEATYQKCKEHIEKWDVDSVFSVLGCEGSIIQLERHLSTNCPICDREHSRDPFCHVRNGALYWHCGRAERTVGLLIVRLQEEGVASGGLLARVNRCRLGDGSGPLEGITIVSPKMKSKPILRILGEECEILPEEPEAPKEVSDRGQGYAPRASENTCVSTPSDEEEREKRCIQGCTSERTMREADALVCPRPESSVTPLTSPIKRVIPLSSSPLMKMRTGGVTLRTIPQSAPVRTPVKAPTPKKVTSGQRTSRATGSASWVLDWDN